ncbi:MAG: hypothetical protein QXU18_00375 [Thermoplasmatales archaeon]
MEMKGFVVGEDAYGQVRRVNIKREVDHVPELYEIEIPELIDLHLVSLEIKAKRNIIGAIDWVDGFRDGFLTGIV